MLVEGQAEGGVCVLVLGGKDSVLLWAITGRKVPPNHSSKHHAVSQHTVQIMHTKTVE